MPRMRSFIFPIVLILSACSASNSADGEETNAETTSEVSGPLLTHSVFFELKDNSPEAIEALVDGAYKYLEPHDGIVYFSAGARHTDYQREVNDLAFDVALTIVFESTDAQDAYQVTEPHKQFIAELEDNWASVRVFDSLAPAPSLVRE
ncbi:Dabb family protein [Qipengyuania sp. DGS5-3]|uniref:Dabb family protein n=1 Tax=Qipengyuania sp. DGS5-3 TaxID=3349632 RepID=UPI0036D2C770